MSVQHGWIGVDLDATLAHYDAWKGIAHIGRPIREMVARVKTWLDAGLDVRIMTARVCSQQSPEDREAARAAITAWCREHLGHSLPVTSEKDWMMIQLWDDRAISVEANTGRVTTTP